MSQLQASSAPAEQFELVWDKATTPLEAIDRALYALADRLTGSVVEADGQWLVALYPRTQQSVDVLRHRFRQEVNDQVLRVRIAARTDPLRNLVFALAFSRSGLAEAQPDGEDRSDEAAQS